MQFEINIDGVHQFVAGITRAGHIGVYINARHIERNGTLDVGGHENVSDEETVFLNWPTIPLTVGQSITVSCVEGQPVQEPSSQQSSKDDSRIRIADPDVATGLNTHILNVVNSLFALQFAVEAAESPENFKKFQLAIDTTLSTFSDNCLVLLPNAHPDLRTPELRNVPL